MISVKKTEIAQSNETTDISEDPDKHCPLHKKTHPLKRCCSFCSKSLEERKTYLKDKNICFKCCASTKHQAKNCQIKVTCKECGSERHNTVLHPGPPPPNSITLPTEVKQHGREPELSTLSVSATAMCTEVCGEQSGSKYA